MCSSFFECSAFAETKVSQVCVGLCIFNLLFAEVTTFSVSLEVATYENSIVVKTIQNLVQYEIEAAIKDKLSNKFEY